jgi:diguanylate cyclase (GGDEF)-like protein
MVTRRSAQSILAEVSATLASSLAAEDILATIARQIGEAMGVFSCDIWEYEPGARRLTFVVTWCAAEENPYGDSVGDTVELDDWDNMLAVVDGRRTVELHGDDPDLPPRDRASFAKWGFQTTVDTPLVHDDRVIGVLGLVETREPRRFTAGERTLCGQLAVQAAIAIHNARALRHLEEQNRQLQALRKIGVALTSTLVFEEALDVMAREAAEALVVSRCIISEYREGDDLLTPLVAHERQPADGLGGPSGRLPAARPSGRLLLGRGTHVEQVSDPSLDPAVREELTERGEHTSLNVPLIYKGLPLGLMRLIETHEERHFSADEIELARGIGEQGALAFQNARLFSSVERLAITDGLTDLYNHRYFYERLPEEVSRAQRYALPLSLLLIDVDDFKGYNDAYGHRAGDAVLHELAALLKSQVRQQVDLVARYGGEEFAVILPNTGVEGATTLGERLRSTIAKDGRPSDQDSALTGDGGAAAAGDSGGALTVAERIRSSIAKETFGPSGASATITVSVGVASFPTHAASVDGLVEAADQSMYVAKARGKNCIAVALPLASA